MMENLGVIQFWTFLAGVVVIILMPGPNSLFVLKTSMVQGPKHAWCSLTAVLLGDATLILLSYLGLASVLLASPELFRWIRYLGAAYLFYIGVQTLLSLCKSKAGDSVEAPQVVAAATCASVFRKSLLLSLTNPKAILFFLSFFIQFIDSSFTPNWVPYLVLALVLEVISLIYLTTLIYAGAAIASFFKGQPKAGQAGNLLLGLLFTGFAVRLALA
ncbi:MAG: leucine efflux protein LeuE [Gammaproteobacteria bacterium]|nr:leucine efflux protein LeuE [Gammaproteobacteria bacterium]MBU2058978.1 leucine efflux protein LeuE [Gammaproteobacteria bacterium]MBU2175033.1 leucine efflux protein LeuE [Gammaproteobacteria bacterium]MBU2246716.1 leucine efflux protein LeuE [Gammaproteobacteria bacterium]MBU2345902.1 leucine efflux protein LeuE [Gammaproteobacteria bacterium]